MIPDRFKKPASGLLVLLILTVGVHAQKKELPSYISVPHQKILQRWLEREEPDLRVATDEDCGRCADNIANQRRLSGADYHPYYAVGDFNGDGQKDFAVALIEVEADAEGKVTQKFVVAVFNAPFSRRRIEPAFFKDNLNLRDGGLFFGPPRSQPYRLFIGLFTTDKGLTLIPRGRKYIGK
jgi:hypothetical protein